MTYPLDFLALTIALAFFALACGEPLLGLVAIATGLFGWVVSK